MSIKSIKLLWELIETRSPCHSYLIVDKTQNRDHKIQSKFITILDIWYLVDWSVSWYNMHSKCEGVGLSSNELMWPLQYDYTLQSRTVMWPLHYIYTLHGLRVSVTLLASHSTHIMKGQPFLDWKKSLIFFFKFNGFVILQPRVFWFLNIFFSIPFLGKCFFLFL